jgi:hypothetical protein
MLANHPNAAHLINSSLKRIYGEGDRIMLGVAWGLLLLSLALAPWYGTWALALTVGITLAAASTAAVFLLPARRGARVLNAVVFMSFSALLIHQAHGMIEMHFIIFGLLALSPLLPRLASLGHSRRPDLNSSLRFLCFAIPGLLHLRF